LISVDVDKLGVVRDMSEVIQIGICILNEMVPNVPLPYNLATIWGAGFDLEDAIWPYVTFCQIFNPPASLECLSAGLSFPGNGKNIPVGQRLDVMMLNLIFVR
jgi:hypothetical protein